MSRVRARPRPVFLVAAAVTLIGGLVSCSSGSHSPPAITALPRSYVVTYRVLQNGAQHWEVLTVHRPFDGSDLTYDTPQAPRASEPPAAGNISTDLALFAVEGTSVRTVSGRQPGPASGDQYLAPELVDLVARKLAADTGKDQTVAGRFCRIYRFLEPPSGPVKPLGGGSDHDDLCLDRSGLLLSERWTYHGGVVLERTATTVRTSDGELSAGVEPPTPSTAGAAPPSAGAGSAVPDPNPDSFLAPPAVPAGYAAAGPAVKFTLPDPQHPASTVAASVIWAFEDGPRFVTVEAGTGRPGQVPWRPDDTVTKPATLRGLGPATTALRSDGTEVRVDVGNGRWVRVRGAMSVAQLTAYAQQLALSVPR
jgi:hypothetical protein